MYCTAKLCTNSNFKPSFPVITLVAYAYSLSFYKLLLKTSWTDLKEMICSVSEKIQRRREEKSLHLPLLPTRRHSRDTTRSGGVTAAEWGTHTHRKDTDDIALKQVTSCLGSSDIVVFLSLSLCLSVCLTVSLSLCLSDCLSLWTVIGWFHFQLNSHPVFYHLNWSWGCGFELNTKDKVTVFQNISFCKGILCQEDNLAETSIDIIW